MSVKAECMLRRFRPQCSRHVSWQSDLVTRALAGSLRDLGYISVISLCYSVILE